MILKTVKILPIILASVNPNGFILEQPKKANTPFQLQLTYENIQDNVIQKGTTPETYQRTTKMDKTQSNSYLLIKSCNYIETIYTNENTDYIIETNTNYTDTTCTRLTTFQIVPYQNTIQDTVSLTAKSRIHIWGGNNYPITAITEIYTSIESYWQNYIDISNFGMSWHQNKQTIDTITNPQMGFLYTKTITQNIIQPNETGNETNFETTFDIALNPSNVNYIYAFTYLTTIQDGVNNNLIINNYEANTWISKSPNANNSIINGYYVEGITNYEVIDLPGIMWEVLTMPFTFISIAFNLTLFPNTPYQVNLSNLFLSILGAIIFIFIMNKFILRR